MNLIFKCEITIRFKRFHSIVVYFGWSEDIRFIVNKSFYVYHEVLQADEVKLNDMTSNQIELKSTTNQRDALDAFDLFVWTL